MGLARRIGVWYSMVRKKVDMMKVGCQGVQGIRLRWDAQTGVTPGWYAEYLDAEGETLGDSMKYDSIDLDGYEEEDWRGVHAALSDAYPEAVIWS